MLNDFQEKENKKILVLGFNKIIFKTGGGFGVHPITIKKETFNKLNRNLLLVYTGYKRTAHNIAKSYVNKLLSLKEKHILKILSYVKEV